MTNKQLQQAIQEMLRHQEELMKFLLQKCSQEEAILVKRLISDYEIIEELIKDEKEEEGKKTKLLPEPEKALVKYLNEMGIPHNIKGYSYIKCAIMLGINDRSILEQITKRLYPKIASEFNTTPSRVERAIRHAIEVAWVRGNMEVCNAIFGYSIEKDKGKPTNSQFITCMVDYILNE